MTIGRFEAAGTRLIVDFSAPLSIAIPLDFGGPQPSCFDAPAAAAEPYRTGGFVGDTRSGGSCNCEILQVAPHCNGTHTECVGHVTEERIAVTDCVPGGILRALLVSLNPVAADSTAEDSDPAPEDGDRLLTAGALAAGVARFTGPPPQAIVIRTLLTAAGPPNRTYSGPAPAPYLSRQAASWLVDRGIDHLVLDLPSADRARDGGRLTAHRIFFGLPAGSRSASAAGRPHASITELAWIPPAIPDGWYLLDLQIPAFLADAAPSRPLLYAVRFE